MTVDIYDGKVHQSITRSLLPWPIIHSWWRRNRFIDGTDE
jgi:hypothetical protein